MIIVIISAYKNDSGAIYLCGILAYKFTTMTNNFNWTYQTWFYSTSQRPHYEWLPN